MRPEQPFPAELALPEPPPFSREFRIEIFCVTCAIVFWFSIKPALVRWLDAQTEAVQTSALGRCRPPAEFEQLHIVVERRPDGLATSCMYVGSQGTYR